MMQQISSPPPPIYSSIWNNSRYLSIGRSLRSGTDGRDRCVGNGGRQGHCWQWGCTWLALFALVCHEGRQGIKLFLAFSTQEHILIICRIKMGNLKVPTIEHCLSSSHYLCHSQRWQMIRYQASSNRSSLLEKYICKITTRVRWRTKPVNSMKLRYTLFWSLFISLSIAHKSVSTYEHVLRDSKTENKDYSNHQCVISAIAVAYPFELTAVITVRCLIDDRSKYNFITCPSALCLHTHRLDGRCSRNALVIWIRDPALTIKQTLDRHHCLVVHALKWRTA